MDTKTLHTYIGVSVAVVFFIIIFGGIFFPLPKIFVSDLFANNIINTQDTLSSKSGLVVSERAKQLSALEDTDVQSQQIQAENRLDGNVLVADLKEGNGLKASNGGTVRIGYVGTFVDIETGQEVEFDRNIDPESGFIFTLGSGQVISGFDSGVEGMREGGVRIVVIQPEAGYGDRQVGSIPPNTTLQFVIELYEVQ